MPVMDLSRRINMKWIKPPVFLAGLAPLANLAWKAFHDNLGANPIEVITHSTGTWTLVFLCVTLCITPLRRLLHQAWLVRFRRMAGLFAFFYGVLHLAIYVWLDKFFDFPAMLQDVYKRPFITAGFSALLLMVPLAATSTSGMIRRLGGKHWQMLHRLVYVSAVAGAIHYYWLVKSDETVPQRFAAVVAILLAYRLLVTFGGVVYQTSVPGNFEKDLSRGRSLAMKRLIFPVILVTATAVLTLLSLRYVRTANAEPRPIGDAAPRTRVLVELFTSEGCSDCPPADALLAKLDRSQPVRDAQLIVLSEHVDYWNDIGWKDPYSSHEFSVRQGDYAHRFRLDSAYTPQMVVDGDAQFVGSDERRAIQAIERAAKAEKVSVGLSSIHLEGNTLSVHVESGTLPPSASSKSASVLLVLADDRDQSNVRRGENAGRILTHVAVVRSLTQVGTIDRDGAFSRDLKVSTENANPRNLRVVAIVQETAGGRILGVGSARLSD